MFNLTPLRDDIVSISAGSHDDFEDWQPTLEQYCIHRADFVEKAKGVDKRYVENIFSEQENDEARGEPHGKAQGETLGKVHEEAHDESTI